MVCDTHCHFFSSRFLELLTQGTEVSGDRAAAVSTKLGWDPPGTPEELADRWVVGLDRHTVARSPSSPACRATGFGRTAVIRHPTRFVGFFMFNPAAGDARSRLVPLLEGASPGRCALSGDAPLSAWTILSSRRCSKSPRMRALPCSSAGC
jgi:hypothetical protein